MTHQKRSKLYLDLSLAATSVIAIILYCVSNRFLSYWFGLTLLQSGNIFMMPAVVMIILLAVILILVLIIRGFILNVRLGINRLLLQIFFIVIPISVLAIVPGLIKGGYIALTEGLFETMKKEADISAIQDWIDNVDLDGITCDRIDEYGWWVSESDWADAIKKFSPYDIDYVILRKTNNNTIYVRVIFGAALVGRFGLVVGVNSEEIPLNIHYVSEHRLELTSNAFVWFGLKREKKNSTASKFSVAETGIP